MVKTIELIIRNAKIPGSFRCYVSQGDLEYFEKFVLPKLVSAVPYKGKCWNEDKCWYIKSAYAGSMDLSYLTSLDHVKLVLGGGYRNKGRSKQTKLEGEDER